MKKLLCAILSAVMLSGCSAPAGQTAPPESAPTDSTATAWQLEKGGLEISAPDGMAENAITTEKTEHHTIVRIHDPGTYILSGKLDAGQIAVDLGEHAKDDPNAVVTLILDGLDITCTDAPAVIFCNVYESGEPGSPCGANVILAEGSQNYVNGSHSEEYDGALYSRMSMTLDGAGALNITADNEGLDSEMHLTINGGTIQIKSGNDGINTNEDGVSVTTINGGNLSIIVSGETGEGDGIDSNGWLIINGGAVFASACGTSGDAGIDSDMGIQINGGLVCASGNMLDRIEDGGQTYAVFSFSGRQEPGSYTLKNALGEIVADFNAVNAFQYLIFSSPALTGGDYTLWSGDTRFQGLAGGMQGHFGAQIIERPDWPERDDGIIEIPPQPTTPVAVQGGEGGMPEPPQGGAEGMPEPPEGGQPPKAPGEAPPEGGHPPKGPGEAPPEGGRPPQDSGFLSTAPVQVFPITEGANYFLNVQPVA